MCFPVWKTDNEISCFPCAMATLNLSVTANTNGNMRKSKYKHKLNYGHLKFFKGKFVRQIYIYPDWLFISWVQIPVREIWTYWNQVHCTASHYNAYRKIKLSNIHTYGTHRKLKFEITTITKKKIKFHG